MAYVTAHNAPSNVWLVPVWWFNTEGISSFDGTEDSPAWPLEGRFSAIDGSLLSIALGR